MKEFHSLFSISRRQYLTHPKCTADGTQRWFHLVFLEQCLRPVLLPVTEDGVHPQDSIEEALHRYFQRTDIRFGDVDTKCPKCKTSCLTMEEGLHIDSTMDATPE